MLFKKIIIHIGFEGKIIFRQFKFLYRRIASPFQLTKYLQRNNIIKINLGCGTNLLEGWLNCDIAPLQGACFLDCSKKLPFSDNTVDYIYSEHTIEHLTLMEAVGFLKECARILKTSGRIRISTPNFRSFIEMYHGNEKTAEYLKWFKDRNKLDIPVTILNCINSMCAEHGHKFIYDDHYLKAILEYCGFKEIKRCEIHKSDDPVFHHLEHHGEVVGDGINEIESLVVEAIK